MLATQKLEPVVELKTDIQRLERVYQNLQGILDFINLPDNILNREQLNGTILRNYYSHALEGEIVDVEHLHEIIAGHRSAKDVHEQKALQYHEAENYFYSMTSLPLSSDIALKGWELLTKGKQASHSNYQMLELLSGFLMEDQQQHPIVQSWIIQAFTVRHQLFNQHSAMMGRLLQFFWLEKHQYTFSGLLCPEQELYSQKAYYHELFNHEPETALQEQEDWDFSKQVNFGLEMYRNQLMRTRLLLRDYFRKQINYQELAPRYKNIMNFVFDCGYRMTALQNSDLNQRQELILYILCNKGVASTKELTEEFGCNRKTIQRDFNELLESGLVRSLGNGSALKYTININESKRTDLNPFQSKVLGQQ